MIRQVKALIHKEILFEWRQKYALGGMALYLLSTIFLVYMAIGVGGGMPEPLVWAVLYWIILLFAAVNTVAKSFIQEKSEVMIYYYTLTSPIHIIIAKFIFNTLLLVVQAFLALAIFSLVLGNPITDHVLFMVNVLLGAVAFAATFTMLSGIASKASNSGTLMAILGFPIIIPTIMLNIKITKNAISGVGIGAAWDEMAILSAIIMMVVATSIMLFPYIWRSN